jgi:antitoxin PrlF
MIKSKLTSKAQTTIPRPVRAALRLEVGDEIIYRIEGDRAILSRAPAQDAVEEPFATFTEWNGHADREAYRGL